MSMHGKFVFIKLTLYVFTEIGAGAGGVEAGGLELLALVTELSEYLWNGPVPWCGDEEAKTYLGLQCRFDDFIGGHPVTSLVLVLVLFTARVVITGIGAGVGGGRSPTARARRSCRRRTCRTGGRFGSFGGGRFGTARATRRATLATPATTNAVVPGHR